MSQTLPVERLFTITVGTEIASIIAGAPQGTRVVVNVTGGTFEGPKLKGTVAAAPGGDWLTARADGSVKLDVRILLLVDDGTPILMTYTGIGTGTIPDLDLRTAPQFEAPEGPHAWLNQVQAIATGRTGEGNVTYEVYRVL